MVQVRNVCQYEYIGNLHLGEWERIGKSGVSQKGSRWNKKAISGSCKNTLMEPTPDYDDYDDGDNQFVIWDSLTPDVEN